MRSINIDPTPNLKVYVILPPEMSHIATRSLFGYNHSSKGCAMYRSWLFNGISFSSHFYIRKIHLLHTKKVYVSLVAYVFINTRKI